MAIAAGNVISAADVLAALVTVDTQTTFTTTTPAGAGWWRWVGPFIELYYASSGNLTSGTSFTSAVILPAGARPLQMIPAAAAGGVALDREANGAINTNGTFTVRNNYSGSTTVSLYALFIPAV